MNKRNLKHKIRNIYCSDTIWAPAKEKLKASNITFSAFIRNELEQLLNDNYFDVTSIRDKSIEIQKAKKLLNGS